MRVGGPTAVEPTTDSSRYFALRVENAAGQAAYVGVGLNKREDAFDLKSALADHSKQLEVEEKGMDLHLDSEVADSLGLDAAAVGGAGAGTLDLSLKEGQTFSFKLGAKSGGPASALVGKSGGAGLGGKLAPPGTVKPAAAAAPPAADSWETF